jgi:hypothetical protein
MMHWPAGLAQDGSGNPHLTSYGAGGCGIGVDYNWWDGSSWQQHPSATMDGQLTMNGAGLPDIAFAGDAYVGLGRSECDTDGCTLTVSVEYWDGLGGEWTALGGPLASTPATGGGADVSLAVDGLGGLYAATTVDDGTGGRLFVARWDGGWTILGGGPAGGERDASAPSVAVIDGVPWIACLEEAAGVSRVAVRRWNGSAFEKAGADLNEDPAADAYEPVIAGVGGVPHVAFREDDAGVGHLFVKRLP